MTLNKPVLLLNAAFEPIRIISMRRSLELLTRGKVVVVLPTAEEVYPGVFRPSVVRLLEYKFVPIRMQLVSKKNVYQRDAHMCQYCGKKPKTNDLTWDHVFPKSRGGKNTWENLVTACKRCNQLKGDRTPAEAGMPLLNRVIPATVHTQRNLLRSAALMVKEWAEFLFVDNTGQKAA